MRRNDRCITDTSDILAIMKSCDVCSLAFYDEGFPYIIPLNFGVEEKEGEFVLYFHCAAEGKKLELLKANNQVAFEMNCSHKLRLAEVACNSSMDFESVCGNGWLETLTAEKKMRALGFLMRQYTRKEEHSFSQADLEEVTVLRLKVNEITGKRLKPMAKPE